jgi:hypothetical protein
MKRFRDDEHWFRLSHGPDPSGRMTRYYLIACHQCGRTVSYHANGLGDDALRKVFARQSWEVGKRQNQHRCPDCNKRDDLPKVSFRVVPQAKQFRPTHNLDAAWQATSETGRAQFFERLCREFYPTIEEQHPEQAPPPAPPPPPPPPPPRPIAVQLDELDDEPAEWWKDLQT